MHKYEIKYSINGTRMTQITDAKNEVEAVKLLQKMYDGKKIVVDVVMRTDFEK